MKNQMLALEAPTYTPPSDGQEVDERDILGTNLKVILYVGKRATLDIVERGANEEPSHLVESLHAPREEAINMYKHPANYLPAQRARELFDPSSITNHNQAA